MALGIYADESVPAATVVGLRRRGVSAGSAQEAGNLGLSDEEQLEYAKKAEAVVFTHDEDFLRLADQWIHERKEHAGVIYAHQQKLSVGECIRRLVNFSLLVSADDLRNRVVFL